MKAEETIMDKRLQNIINHAYNNSEYYRSHIDNYNSLQSFYQNFILTKKDILDNHRTILSQKFNENVFKVLNVNTTSGTSGRPLEILWESSDILKSNLVIWRLRKKFYNITASDKYCTLHTISYSGNRINKVQKVILGNNNISLCKLFEDDQTMIEYYNIMKQYSPSWLMVQPSFMLRFVECLENYNLPPIPSINFIEFNGEFLTDSCRKRISAFFNCKTANLYGCMETNAIAYECPHHKLHILEDNIRVETDANNNIYLTSLHNHAFPLIKYQVGDIVKISHEQTCECGMTGMIISEILGRSSKQCKLSSGELLNESTIAYCIDRAEAVITLKIKQYKAILENEKLQIIINCENQNVEWQNKFVDESKRLLHEFFPKLPLTYKFIDNPVETWSLQRGRKYSLLEVRNDISQD